MRAVSLQSFSNKVSSTPETPRKKTKTSELLETLRDIAKINKPTSPAPEKKLNGELFKSFFPVLEMAYVSDTRIPMLIDKLFAEGITSMFALKQCTYEDLRDMKFQIGEARCLVAVLEGIEAFPRQVFLDNQPSFDGAEQQVANEDYGSQQNIDDSAEETELPCNDNTAVGIGGADDPVSHLDSDGDITEDESQALFGNSAVY